MNKCPECGAERPSWMGGHHECMVKDHPYDYFMWLIGAEDE